MILGYNVQFIVLQSLGKNGRSSGYDKLDSLIKKQQQPICQVKFIFKISSWNARASVCLFLLGSLRIGFIPHVVLWYLCALFSWCFSTECCHFRAEALIWRLGQDTLRFCSFLLRSFPDVTLHDSTKVYLDLIKKYIFVIDKSRGMKVQASSFDTLLHRLHCFLR